MHARSLRVGWWVYADCCLGALCIFVGCLPGFTGVFGEGSKPLPGGVREGNSESDLDLMSESK